ncbi:MAG: hypothetical protein ABW066_06755 [Sedimenticola sp.]
MDNNNKEPKDHHHHESIATVFGSGEGGKLRWIQALLWLKAAQERGEETKGWIWKSAVSVIAGGAITALFTGLALILSGGAKG